MWVKFEIAFSFSFDSNWVLWVFQMKEWKGWKGSLYLSLLHFSVLHLPLSTRAYILCVDFIRQWILSTSWSHICSSCSYIHYIAYHHYSHNHTYSILKIIHFCLSLVLHINLINCLTDMIHQGETPCKSNEVTAILLCSLFFMRQDYCTIEVYEHIIDTKDE